MNFFVLGLSLVWFAGATPDEKAPFPKDPFLAPFAVR